MHAFNPRALEAVGVYELKASLVSRESSQTVRVTRRELVSKQNETSNNKNTETGCANVLHGYSRSLSVSNLRSFQLSGKTSDYIHKPFVSTDLKLKRYLLKSKACSTHFPVSLPTCPMVPSLYCDLSWLGACCWMCPVVGKGSYKCFYVGTSTLGQPEFVFHGTTHSYLT